MSNLKCRHGYGSVGVSCAKLSYPLSTSQSLLKDAHAQFKAVFRIFICYLQSTSDFSMLRPNSLSVDYFSETLAIILSTISVKVITSIFRRNAYCSYLLLPSTITLNIICTFAMISPSLVSPPQELAENSFFSYRMT